MYERGVLTPNGREVVIRIKAGRNGTGPTLASVRYWPWSKASREAVIKVVKLQKEYLEEEQGWEITDDEEYQ